MTQHRIESPELRLPVTHALKQYYSGFTGLYSPQIRAIHNGYRDSIDISESIDDALPQTLDR